MYNVHIFTIVNVFLIPISTSRFKVFSNSESKHEHEHEAHKKFFFSLFDSLIVGNHSFAGLRIA